MSFSNDEFIRQLAEASEVVAHVRKVLEDGTIGKAFAEAEALGFRRGVGACLLIAKDVAAELNDNCNGGAVVADRITALLPGESP